jgi:uncharacterized membrane protein YccF (DUF307 family)
MIGTHASFKLVPAAFWPLGRDIVDLDDPRGAIA